MADNTHLKQEALAKRLATLPPPKRDAFLRLLQKEGIEPTKLPIVPVTDRQTNTFPLSWPQERLWFIHQLEGPSATYNIHLVLRISSPIRVEALEKTLDAIAQRHDILRTTFDTVEGKPVQIIHDPVATPGNWPLRIEDWQDWAFDPQGQPYPELETKLRAFTRQQAQIAFDLTTLPLARATLLQLSPNCSMLCLEMHHIIWDAWSTGVFAQEFSQFYQAYSQGQTPTLSPLPIQYVDYAVWQRQWLQGTVFATQIDYWKQQLADVPVLLELPSDRPRPAIQGFQGNTHIMRLDSTLSQQINALAQKHQVTLFMVLLAAFQLLLRRYSGQHDIVVGSPIANRQRAELEPLLGFFINTLALRTQIDDSDTVSQLLSQVRRTTLDAYAHQDVPFEQIVDALQLKRTLAHSPLFQVLFVLQNAPMAALELPDLALTPLVEETHIAKFDLTLEIEDSDQGLVGYWIYNSDLFEADTIARMGCHFEILLTAMVEDESQLVGTLPLLSPAERQQILVDWNHAVTVPSQPQCCIHELFEQQVSLRPDAVAVVYDQEQLSYQDLNSKANQLARHLQTLGVGPETLVGICVERSLEMVVGLLAILKAGGAYVPMNPSYPPERLQFMLQDTQVSVLLTHTALLEKVTQLTQQSAQIVCFDRDWADLAHHSPLNLSTALTPANLAYVIYTSGSTGTPKGVMVSHQNVVRLFKTTEPLYHFNHQDCWTLFHSYAFDFSVWELWGALGYGGRLVIVPYWVSRSSQEFYDLLIEQQVTVLNQTPSAFSQLIQVDASHPADALTLRYVIFGGEALAVESLRPWFEKHGDQHPQLVNMYGITETTVHVTYRPLNKADLECSISPIGRALGDLQSFILDSFLQLVPIGVPGELHIGGPGVARGYLNRPELTVERFIDHPFGSGRLYKTGDLARYLPDGSFEYLGRIDHQVKIRGFRIELGEIEAVLRQHPQLRDVVVMVQPDPAGQSRLVAYLTPQHKAETPVDINFDISLEVEAPCSVRELRQWLQTRLPDYMVPSAFVWLAQLPLNTNGKIDRAKLQALDGFGGDTPSALRHRSSLDTPFTAPQSPLEQQLADIWSQVLDIPTIGIHDNFFELGGDSILSIQIIAQARKAGVPLNPKQLFQYQTVSELAYAITHESAVPILAQQGQVTGSVPLTPIQRWFLEQHWSNPHHFNQAILLQVPPDLDEVRLRQSLADLVTHHDALRLRFECREGQWHQAHNADGVDIPLETVDLSDLSTIAQEQELAAIATQKQASLHLSQGPVGRAVLFNLGTQQRLLLIVHHLVIDGVSWRILLGDLWDLYCSTQQPAQLPPKTTAYQDWSLQLETYSQSDDLKAQLDYWLKLPWAQVTSLPVDIANAPTDSTVAEMATLSTSLGTEETEQLLHQVPDAYNTQMNDALLTALGEAIAPWLSSNTVLINLEGHGRDPLFETVDLSRTVGWFTSLYPVVLTTEPQKSPGDNLKAVKEYLRQVPDGGIGYGLLRYMAQDTALNALPTPQISFNYLGQIEKGVGADWYLAPESLGSLHDSGGQRPHLIDINAQIVAGKLNINWSYSRAHHHPETIKQLAQNYIYALKKLIGHCLAPDVGGYTPSDFPMADLSQTDLDDVIQQLSL
ncbi:MAG: amino acid adenylation domain-containing protein [Synechococcales bacterium]|nr:amino acid adenylation domain-containing protein [Synechococcales bacterium]